jgi:hypothetical protein
MARMTIAALLISLPFAAQAQQAPPPAQQQPPQKAQEAAKPQQAPTVRVYGVTIKPDAPVSPSYAGTAYRTLGGQPETGQDAIAGQVMQPTTADQPH